jgi:hypothetical protein
MAGGQQVTSGQGSVTQSGSKALTGTGLVGSTGTIVADAGNGVALSGAASSSAVGGLASGPLVQLRSRKVGGGTATAALVGASASSERGSVAAGMVKAPSGQVTTNQQGAVGKNRLVVPSGQAAAGSAGIVAPSGSTLTWTGNIFPMTIPQSGFFDLSPFISDPSGELANITANVALPSGVAITNTPSWRVTASAGATLGTTSGVNLTLVRSATADFLTRISGTGVVWYHSFDTDTEVSQFKWSGKWDNSEWGGNDPLSIGPDSSRCLWVASGGADGGPFMRLSYPLGANSSGTYWYRPFNAFTGAGNGRGVNDPGANGTITPVAWSPTSGGSQTARWSADGPNAGYYGHSTYQAANPTKFQGGEFYIQVRIRRNGTPGPAPDNATFQNIVGKSFWPNVTTNTSTAQELVFYGQSPADVVGVHSRARIYEGANRSGGPSIGGNNMTTTIDNNDNVNDWRYSGGWDTLLLHITPGLNNGTGADRTRLEVWAQHDPALVPSEAGVYTKIWDVLYSAAFDQGTTSAGVPCFNGWNALILAIYHNGATFTTSSFSYDYDQVIFSKASIPAPQV